MSSKSVEQKVEELLLNEIINLGYELYDVLYVKEGKDYYLRIIIDSEKGISFIPLGRTAAIIDSDT